MGYRKFDREKLGWAPQSKLSTILSALLIPEDFEFIDEIEEYLLPDDSPKKRRDLDEIRADLEAKIDKLTKQRVGLSRHYLERGNGAFQSLKQKQERNFENLKLYGTVDIQRAFTGSNWIERDYESGSALLSTGNVGLSWSPSLAIKPRNWFAKQVLRLFLDMGPS